MTEHAGGFLHQIRDARFYTRRGIVLVGVAAAHLLLLAWVLYGAMNSDAGPRVRNLAAIDISQDVPKPDAPAKPAVVRPDPNVRMVALLPSALTVPVAPAAAGSGTGNGCSVASTLGAALSADPAAMAELAALPSDVRSEADAVMVWNGSWLGEPAPASGAPTEPAPPPGLPTAPIPAMRTVIAATLLALPPACRDVETHGPQFVPIAEPGRTTMLVIGSGVWRWGDLVPAPTPTEGTGLFGSLWPGSGGAASVPVKP